MSTIAVVVGFLYQELGTRPSVELADTGKKTTAVSLVVPTYIANLLGAIRNNGVRQNKSSTNLLQNKICSLHLQHKRR